MVNGNQISNRWRWSAMMTANECTKVHFVIKRKGLA